MLKKIKKKYKKILIVSLIALITTSIVAPPIRNVYANSHSVSESFDGSWKAIAGNVGLRGNATRFRVDGQVAWCLEPNKAARPGINSEFDISQIGMSIEQKKTINLITNFGYYAQPSPTNEILTGNLIWRYLGNTCGYVSASNGYPTMASQQGWFDDVMNKVNRYGTNISFDKTSYEISVGETVVLNDTNGVLQDMQVISTDGLEVWKNGNQLVIKGMANANDNSTIILKKVVSNEDRDFVVRSGNSQALSVCKIGDPLQSQIKFKVNKNYEVAFNGNGASNGSMTNQTFLYNQYQNLKANTFSKIGHTFGGWNTASNGSGASYNNQQSVKNLTSPNSVITLYAKWVNTPPNIITPTLPNPNPPGASNIPPIIDGGKLVIQLGDKLEAIKYFTANDKEDGNITDKIIITNNPVPLDKNLNAIKSGEYVVSAKVTDLGGLSNTANLTVLVNEPPTIQAEDRWFLQDQAVNRDNLLEQVIAMDKEDGDLHSKIVIDYIKYQDGRVVNNPTSFDTSFVNETGIDDIKETVSEIKYTVSDKYGKSATTVAKLHLSRDIQKFKEKRKKTVRYIDLKNINTLDKTSLWKVDSGMNKRLASTLSKTDQSQAKVVYSYTNKELKEIKAWVRENKPSQGANQTYVTKYLNTNISKGGLK